MIPLSDRICIAAVCSGVTGVDGHPKCLGELCSSFEICSRELVVASHEIEKHRRKTRNHKRRWVSDE